MYNINLFLLGAAKCGTTTMYYHLRNHYDICMSDNKEPHIFNKPNLNNNELTKYLLKEYKDNKCSYIGDATPDYFHKPDIVIKNFNKFLSDELKFIIILRDPVLRAYSHYKHMVRNQLENRNFVDAVVGNINNKSEKWYNYYHDSIYGNNLEIWFNNFKYDKFKIILFEEFVNNTQNTMSDIFQFLGVDDITIDDNIKSNVSSKPISKTISKIVNSEYDIKDAIKKHISKNKRKKIKRNINKIIMKKDESEITKEEYEYIIRYFYNDIEKIKYLTDLNLSRWRYE